MTYILKAFKAEWLKTKGLGLLIFALAVAAVSPLLIFGLHLFDEDARAEVASGTSLIEYFITKSFTSFSSFFLVLFVIIAAARIAQTDHKNNGWVFLETQPLSKFSIYLAKFLTTTVLCIVSIVAFYVFAIFFALIEYAFFAPEKVTLATDFGAVLQNILRLIILATGLASFQIMLSVIIPGFIWPFIVGFLGFILNIVSSIQNRKYDFVVYNNLQTSTEFKNPNDMNFFLNYTDILALFWAAIFFIIGFVVYKNRGFKNAFFASSRKIMTTLGVAAVMAGLYFWIVKPIYMEKLADKTEVSGTVQSEKPVKFITIYETGLNEKIAQIEVKNGKFTWKTQQNIPLGIYRADVEGRNATFLMSKGDQIHFDFNISAANFEAKQKGSRSAEFAYQGDNNYSYFYDDLLKDKKLINDPEEFYKQAQKVWEKQKKNLANFRTSENIYMGDDYRNYVSQLNAAKMLNAIGEYRTMTSKTDQKFAPPAGFQKELNELMSRPTGLIAKSQEYSSWKLRNLIPADVQVSDSLVFAKINALPAGQEKDQLLRTQLLKSLTINNDEEKRNEIFQTNSAGFSNAKYRTFVHQQLQVINSQQKGKPFPQLIFEDAAGKKITPESYKGKYVVFDFWATWCAPCRETSPVFDAQAANYKYNDNVIFVAASIDKEKEKWKLDIKGKKSNVTHVWVANQEILQSVGVNAIPRFMMMDPEGKMYNANMPKPMETGFGEILTQAVGRSFVIFD